MASCPSPEQYSPLRYTEPVDSTPSRDPAVKVEGHVVLRSTHTKYSSNILKCLEADKVHRSLKRGPLFHRQQYLNNGLLTAKSIYSTDIVGHHGCVNALAFSHSMEEFLVTGGDDKRVLVWRVADVIQGRKSVLPISLTTQHTSNIFTADFSCDNAFLFSGGDDSELVKHDFKTGQFISSYQHLDAVYCVASHPSSPSVAFTSSEDGCVYIIDTRTPVRLNSDMVLCEDIHPFQCVAVNPVEPRLVAVSNGYKGTTLHDTRQRKEVMRYHCTKWHLQREDGVSVCFNATGTQLFTMQRRLPPCLFDIWNKEAKYTFIDDSGGYKNSVTMKSGCFMGQRDEFVVSGSDDFRVYVWKVPTEGEESHCEGAECSHPDSCVSTAPHLILPGHRSIVNQTRYSRVHHIMATSGVEKIVKIWSDQPLHLGNSVNHSRAPPARRKYTFEEFTNMASGDDFLEPSDPLQEDPTVLALFDSLVEQDEKGELNSPLSTSSSSLDLDSSPTSSALSTTSFESSSELELDFGNERLSSPYSAWIELPFYDCEDIGLEEETESSSSSSNPSTRPATPTLQRDILSLAESPWSDRETQEVERELREVLGSSANGWGNNYEEGDGRANTCGDIEDNDKSSMKHCSEGACGSSSQTPRSKSPKLHSSPSEIKEERTQNGMNDLGHSSAAASCVSPAGPAGRGKGKRKMQPSNLEQYHREDFLKPKAASTFYSQKPDDSSKKTS